jgi:hypothetical protein
MRPNETLCNWLTGSALAFPLVLVLSAALFGYNILYDIIALPVLLLIWAATAIIGVVLSLRSAWRGARRRGLAALLLMLGLLAVTLDLSGFLRLTQRAGNILRFTALRPSYDTRIASLPTHPRIAEFDWDGMVWVTFAVVYDESDELTLPPQRQSAAWREQAKANLVCDGYGVIQPFWAHYYLVSFPC